MEKKITLSEIESIVRNRAVSKGNNQDIKAFVVLNNVNTEEGSAKCSTLMNGSVKEIAASIAMMMMDHDVVREIIYTAVKCHRKFSEKMLEDAFEHADEALGRIIEKVSKLAAEQTNENRPKDKHPKRKR
jgi:hypothetical protein